MCQLCLTNLGTKRRNIQWTGNQLLINSMNSHQDGVGIFDTGDKTKYIWKSVLAPIYTSNLAECVYSSIKTTKPIISHVRLATKRTLAGEVTKERAHPFLSPCKEFILAHNGTLEFRIEEEEEAKEKSYKDLIDTEIFVAELSEVYKKERLMVDALKVTMEKFTGKFAFLIYSFREDITFVVRGASAKLFMTTVLIDKKEVGFIINTEKESLARNMRFFAQNMYMTNKEVVTYKILDKEEHTVEELDEETIYIVQDDGLKKVDSITENRVYRSIYSKPRVAPRSTRNNRTRSWTEQENKKEKEETKEDSSPLAVNRPFTTLTEKKQIKGINSKNDSRIYNTTSFKKTIDSIIAWSITYNVTVKELDYLFFVIYGHGLMGAEDEELQYFIQTILRKLGKEGTKDKRKRGWNRILKKYPSLEPIFIYATQPNLNFPWMLNALPTLQKIADNVVPIP